MFVEITQNSFYRNWTYPLILKLCVFVYFQFLRKHPKKTKTKNNLKKINQKSRIFKKNPIGNLLISRINLHRKWEKVSTVVSLFVCTKCIQQNKSLVVSFVCVCAYEWLVIVYQQYHLSSFSVELIVAGVSLSFYFCSCDSTKFGHFSELNAISLLSIFYLHSLFWTSEWNWYENNNSFQVQKLWVRVMYGPCEYLCLLKPIWTRSTINKNKLPTIRQNQRWRWTDFWIFSKRERWVLAYIFVHTMYLWFLFYFFWFLFEKFQLFFIYLMLISHNWLDFKQTFRPKKRFTQGTIRYSLHKQAQASLQSGINLRQVVKLPEGENMNDWIAVHGIVLRIFFFFGFI